MANNVHFNISIETNNEDKLKEVLDFAETENGEMKWKTWEAELFPIYPEPYTEEGWYAWGCDNMGAKWVCIEDADTSQITGYSAWSPPIPMINHLAEFLGNGTSIRMTYEDEFRNFIGIAEAAYNDNTLHEDYEELDSGDVELWILEPLELEEIPEDFEWWEPHPKLGDWTPQEYLDEKVYEWFNEN